MSQALRFLRAGGRPSFTEWSLMDEATQEQFVRAGMELERERASLVAEALAAGLAVTLSELIESREERDILAAGRDQ